MSGKSSIEWTEATWNPFRGCRKVSAGCKHCYAETFAERFRGVKGHPYERGFDPRFVPEALSAPLHWKKPRRVFVNSMSDPFLEDFSNVEIAAMFGVMAACPRHTFQLLTKRSKRMREWFGWIAARPSGLLGPYSPSAACGGIALKHWIGPSPPWPLPNLWLGVSAEDQERANERIPDLLATPAEVKFVSYEPALGPVDFYNILADGADLGWIIVGGESGRGARPFDIGWARSVVRQCKAYGVPCFVKQMGDNAYERAVHGWSRLRRKDGKALVRKGGDPSEWPEDLRVREYPEESP